MGWITEEGGDDILPGPSRMRGIEKTNRTQVTDENTVARGMTWEEADAAGKLRGPVGRQLQSLCRNLLAGIPIADASRGCVEAWKSLE